MYINIIRYSALILAIFSYSVQANEEEELKASFYPETIKHYDSQDNIPPPQFKEELKVARNTTNIGRSNLEQLPNELLLQIFHFLEGNDFKSISLLNRFFNKLIQDQFFLESYLRLNSSDSKEFNSLCTPKEDKIIPSYDSLMLAVLSGDFFKVFNEKYFDFKKKIFTVKEKSLPKANFSSLCYKFLPKEVSLLTNVRSLFLNNNEFRIIPEEFQLLTQLEELSLNNNKINQIPLAILSIKSLKRLSMAGNIIQTIPPDIESLIYLEELNLGSNKLHSFLPTVLHLPSLRKLYLDCNKISTLPTGIKKEIKVQYINILDNPITNYNSIIKSYLDQGIEIIF